MGEGETEELVSNISCRREDTNLPSPECVLGRKGEKVVSAQHEVSILGVDLKFSPLTLGRETSGKLIRKVLLILSLFMYSLAQI